MRVISNSLMTALVVIALFWGNCLSCPEVLLASSAGQPAHGCCHRSHQPAPKTTCQSQALQHFVQAAKADTPVTVVAVTIQTPADQPLPLQAAANLASAPEATPPDLVSLNSSLRI